MEGMNITQECLRAERWKICVLFRLILMFTGKCGSVVSPDAGRHTGV